MQRYGSHIAMAILLGLLVTAVIQSVRHDATGHAMVGASANDFQIPRLSDGSLTGPQNHLGRVVLLDFWATYCGPCRDAMPGLQRIHNDYSTEDFSLLSINMDPIRPGSDRPALVQQFQARYGLSFPVLFDTGQASSAYNVLSIPHVVLIDRQGTVRFVHDRTVSENVLRNEIETLLAESS